MALTGLTWEVCLAYLDDLIIFSSTFKQHLEHLQFLGSIVSSDGIEPDPEKVQAVADWPRPQNLTEV